MSGTSDPSRTVRVLVHPVVGLSQNEHDLELRILERALIDIYLKPIWVSTPNQGDVIAEVAAAGPEDNILGIGNLVWTTPLERVVDVPINHLSPSDYLVIKRSAFLWVRKAFHELICSRAFQIIGIAFILTAWVPAFLITLMERTVENSPFYGANLWWTPLYYGLVTASTVGYGDFSPKTPPAQMLSVFILVSGAFCLVSLIQIVVPLFKTAFKTTSLTIDELSANRACRIAFVRGTPGEQTVAAVKSEQLIAFASYDDLFRALVDGGRRIDAAVINPFIAHKLIKAGAPYQIGTEAVTDPYRLVAITPQRWGHGEELRLSLLALEQNKFTATVSRNAMSG
jgi:hypothetical protein